MVDPNNVTKYDRTDAELQEFLMFSVLVAGKNAFTTARLLDAMLTGLGNKAGRVAPAFQLLAGLSFAATVRLLRKSGFGCFNKNAEALVDLGRMIAHVDSAERPKLDIRTCQPAALEAVRGIGPKTSRFFIVHSRPACRYAVLDRHILRHLVAAGVTGVPASTPTAKQYTRLEQEFLTLADRAGMSPADYDLHVWRTATNVTRGNHAQKV